MTDPRPLAELVRDMAEELECAFQQGLREGYRSATLRREADTLHEAAEALEARKDHP